MAAARGVLVAPDSFKGTFGAPQVARAIGRGLERAGLQADCCPVADGGEGTMEVVLAALGGRIVEVEVRDPLGRKIRAPYAQLNGRALVEMAAASGLGLLSEDELDPWGATTYGTGELICAAAGGGALEIMVGIGGSATVDGGVGALQAIERCGGIGEARLVMLCDVQTPWERCAEVYGPQKGADEEMVGRLAARLDELAARLPQDPRGVPMTGGAGGLSGGLWAGLGAALEPGAAYVLDVIGFDERLRAVDAVVVGEGRLDEQSAMGKIVGEISGRARAAGIPAHAIVGRARASAEDVGLESIAEASTLEEIEAAAERLGRTLS